MNKEERKTRKRKIEDSDKPKKKRAPPKPKQQSDDENKIDLNIVKRALEGNPSQAQKFLKSSSKS